MIEFLAMQVRLGRISLEQVPERFRADVEAVLHDPDSRQIGNA